LLLQGDKVPKLSELTCIQGRHSGVLTVMPLAGKSTVLMKIASNCCQRSAIDAVL